MAAEPQELRQAAADWLAVADPRGKATAVRAGISAVGRVDPDAPVAAPLPLPGRPDRPRLVDPAQVPRPVIRIGDLFYAAPTAGDIRDTGYLGGVEGVLSHDAGK